MFTKLFLLLYSNIDNEQYFPNNGYERNSDKISYKNTKDLYKQTLDIIHTSIVISVQYKSFNRAFFAELQI